MVGVTIGIGPKWYQMALKNKERAKKYLGIDTVVLTEYHLRKYGVNHPWWLKTLFLDLFPTDTVLFYDADLIWTDYWDVSNLEFQPEIICTRDLINSSNIRGEAENFRINPTTYFNAGLLIINRRYHLDWMQMVMRMGLGMEHSTMFEQTTMNRAQQKLKVPLRFLTSRHNFICQPPLTGLTDLIRFIGVHPAGEDKGVLEEVLDNPSDARPFKAVDLPEIFHENTVSYNRVGFDTREMRLSPDGHVLSGVERCESRWVCFSDEESTFLSLCGTNSETCRMKLVGDKFIGRWVGFEQMDVELLPRKV